MASAQCSVLTGGTPLTPTGEPGRAGKKKKSTGSGWAAAAGQLLGAGGATRRSEANRGLYLREWQLTSQAQDLVAAPFQRAREGGREGGREADAPRASLYLKGLTANCHGWHRHRYAPLPPTTLTALRAASQPPPRATATRPIRGKGQAAVTRQAGMIPGWYRRSSSQRSCGADPLSGIVSDYS